MEQVKISKDLDTQTESKQKEPFICAGNLTLCLNSNFDALEDIVAVDELDGDLTNRLVVVENTVNMNEAGTYSVIYKVTNSLNVTKALAINVNVINCKQPTSICRRIICIIQKIVRCQTRITYILECEANKIIKVTQDENSTTEDMLSINKCVDERIKKLVNFEARLQAKLDWALSLYNKYACNELS